MVTRDITQEVNTGRNKFLSAIVTLAQALLGERLHALSPMTISVGDRQEILLSHAVGYNNCVIAVNGLAHAKLGEKDNSPCIHFQGEDHRCWLYVWSPEGVPTITDHRSGMSEEEICLALSELLDLLKWTDAMMVAEAGRGAIAS